MTLLNHVLTLPKLAYIEDLLEDRRVLVLGSDLGFAATEVAERAREVVVVDPSRVRLHYHRNRYPLRKIRFLLAQLEATGLADASFDVVIALAPPFDRERAPLLLEELRRVLDPDGFLFLALPAPGSQGLPGQRPATTLEPAELRNELRAFFPHVELLAQHVGLAVSVGDDVDALPNYQLRGPDGSPPTQEYLALCSRLLIMPEDRLLAQFPLEPQLANLRHQSARRRRQLRAVSAELEALKGLLARATLSPENLAGLVEHFPAYYEDGTDGLDGARFDADAPGLATAGEARSQAQSEAEDENRSRGRLETGTPELPPSLHQSIADEVVRLGREKVHLQSEVWRLETEVQRLNSETRARQTEIERLRAEVEQLTGELDTSRGEIARLEGHFRSQTDEAQLWLAELETSRAELEARQGELEARRAELRRLEDEHLDLQISVEESQGALDAAERVRQELLEQLRTVTQAMELQAEQIETFRRTGVLPQPPAGRPLLEQAGAGSEPKQTGAERPAAELEADVERLREDSRAQQQHFEEALAREQLKNWILDERVAAMHRLLEQAGIELPPNFDETSITFESGLPSSTTTELSSATLEFSASLLSRDSGMVEEITPPATARKPGAGGSAEAAGARRAAGTPTVAEVVAPLPPEPPVGAPESLRATPAAARTAGAQDLSAPATARTAGAQESPAPVPAAVRAAGAPDLPAPATARAAGAPESPAPATARTAGAPDLPAPATARAAGVPESPAPATARAAGAPESRADTSESPTPAPARAAATPEPAVPQASPRVEKAATPASRAPAPAGQADDDFDMPEMASEASITGFHTPIEPSADPGPLPASPPGPASSAASDANAPDLKSWLEPSRPAPTGKAPAAPGKPTPARETHFAGGLDDMPPETTLPRRIRRIEAAMAAQFEALDHPTAPADAPPTGELAPTGSAETPLPEQPAAPKDRPLPAFPTPSLEVARGLLEGWDDPVDPGGSGLMPGQERDASISFLLEEDAAKAATARGKPATEDRPDARAASFTPRPASGVVYPGAPARGPQPTELPQRGELALLDALAARNLGDLPSVTQHVEDEVERALLDVPLEEMIAARFRKGKEGEASGRTASGTPAGQVAPLPPGAWKAGESVPGSAEVVASVVPPSTGERGTGPGSAPGQDAPEGLFQRLFSRKKR